MPAQPLTEEQKADSARLRAAFIQWQDAQKVAKAPWSQLHVAFELGFKTQSAVSQYINGEIPLNAWALAKFCRLLELEPAQISPSIAASERAKFAALEGVFSPEAIDLGRKLDEIGDEDRHRTAYVMALRAIAKASKPPKGPAKAGASSARGTSKTKPARTSGR